LNSLGCTPVPDARIDPPALPEWARAFAAVEQQAAQAGVRALVVGGYVRDRLLGGGRAAAIREVDILVEGQGAIELAISVGNALNTAHPPVVFERFGTAHLDLDGGQALEFVSSRSESYERNSRKPQVRAATLEEDVLRRDFTVNSLLMQWDGQVIDLTRRGLQDLKARRIVTPLDPQATFDEDPLRMLRAVRFATTLEFALDPAVSAAIKQHARRLQPPVVSMERIRDEFSKLLLAEKTEAGLLLLDSVGLLVQILPQLEAGKGMQQGGWHSHDVFGHSLLTASLTRGDLTSRLAGLLHDVGKPACHELKDAKPTFIGHQEIGASISEPALHRLRYPGTVIESVVKLVRLHMRPIQYDPDGWEDKAVRRLVRDAGDQLQRLLDLARADMRASHFPDVKKIDDLEARIERLDAEAIAAIRSPLTGDDLMKRTGRPAGPWIKRVKGTLEDAIVDGALAPDPDSAWRYLDAHPELLTD
jgi:tRNA nucleotidyltransferase/poly(A) polymerase